VGPNPDGQTPDIEGLAGKVFYVWFDAPIEYIAATWEWADGPRQEAGREVDDAEWERWWRLPSGGGRHLCGVHGQGQRALPHRGVPLTLFGVNERRDADGPSARPRTRPGSWSTS
jgi:methionyl-tRNA synthetase